MGRLADRLAGIDRCPLCKEPRVRGKCLRCASVQRGHDRTAKRTGIDPRPHTCPRPGCGGTVRSGVCPDPRGVH